MDFLGGTANSKGVCKSIILAIYLENCMKLKQIGPRGGEDVKRPLGSANAFLYLYSSCYVVTLKQCVEHSNFSQLESCVPWCNETKYSLWFSLLSNVNFEWMIENH